MVGIRGSRYAVFNVYNLILVLRFTQLVHCTANGDLVKVEVHTDKALVFGKFVWNHVAAEVSGGGAWLRGVGCLSNDTCGFWPSDKNNAIKVGEYQNCIDSSSCMEQKFTAVVVDPAQILTLRIFRYEDGTTIDIAAKCVDTNYTLSTSPGVSQFMRFTYSGLEYNGTWTGYYKCERDSTATISSTTVKPTNDSTGTAEPPNNTSPSLTSVPPHPEMSTGSYNLTISQNTSSTGGQNSTPTTGATSESTSRDLKQTERADKTSSGPNLTTIIVPVVVGVGAIVAIVAVVLVLCRRRRRKAESPPIKSGPVIQNSVYCSANTRAEDYNVVFMEEPNQSPVDQNAETNPNGSAKDDPDNSSELSYQLLVRSMGDNPTFKKDSSNPALHEEYTAVVKPNSHKLNNESQAEELYCEVDTTPTDVFLPKVDLVENDLYDSFRDEIEPPSEYYNL